MTQKPSLSEKLGMHPELAIGFLGLLLFMIGDGVESGFLSPYMLDLHFKESQIALAFTLYGVAAALASWLSGVLSDLVGPKKVMWAGLLIWLVMEVPFLTLGLAHSSYRVILLCYMIRGLGYPLFAFGFLVWVTAVTPQRYLATSVGWFWFARSGGLPTLGSLFASYSVPRHGPYATLWYSVFFVALGGFIALLGIKEPRGTKPLRTGEEHPFRVLLLGISIFWRVPKVGLGGIVAVITTTSEFGFLLFLPIFYIHTVGFTLPQWLQILTVMFATNIFSIFFGDGWVTRLVGGPSSPLSELVVAPLRHLVFTMFRTSSARTTPMSCSQVCSTGRPLQALFLSEPLWLRSLPNHAELHYLSSILAPASVSGWVPPSLVSSFRTSVSVE